MSLDKLDTPALVLEKEKLVSNIKSMSEFAEKYSVRIRPHIKSHKCSKIANLQLDYGAIGITVAKISEAEVMFKAGINDILIAYQIVTREKIEKLQQLIINGAKITCLVDELNNVENLNNAFKDLNKKLPVYVEVDSGLQRSGIMPEKAVEFIRKLQAYPFIHFQGILTHAGHVYGSTKNQVPSIGVNEGTIMEEISIRLKQEGITGFEVSVGSTPTVKYSGKNTEVTEIRPGNYVFNDAIQVGLGVAEIDNCSLKVLSSVISKPTDDRIVIDAGSKTLALDKGAHGTEVVKGYGIVLGYPNLTIERLSEEHGIISINEGKGPELGEKIIIIPNHACPVVNLAEELYIIDNNKVVDKWNIDARGKNK